MFNLPEDEEDQFSMLGLPQNSPAVQQAPPMMPPGAPPQAPPMGPAAASPEMNPLVKEFLSKKYDLGDYSQENRAKLAKENEVGFGDKGMAALAALGAGFMGKDAAAAGGSILNRAKEKGKAKLDEFDRGRANTVQDISLDKEFDKSDPESDRNVAFRKSIQANFPRIAQSYGDSWNNVTLEDQEALFKPLQLKEQTDARKEAARAAAGGRADAREDRKLQRDMIKNEKDQKLQTPFGMANSEDDAKKLKDAYESKANFDGKLKEMIALREKHGGGATLNREDVTRGKQLSKDLMLMYKDMAKLGVLSKSDENILNQIIPADPLEYNSPLAAIQGQDPTLNRLQKFQSDSDKDFQTKVGTRTRAGVGSVASTPPPPPSVDTVVVISPKGIAKKIPRSQLKVALANGGTLQKSSVAGGN